MPATNKVGTQLLVSRHIRARAQALALVRQESVAEVYRILIEAALPAMEATHFGPLKELDDALSRIGGERHAVLDLIGEQKIRFGDLFDEAGRPTGVMPAPRSEEKARAR